MSFKGQVKSKKAISILAHTWTFVFAVYNSKVQTINYVLT